MKDEYIIISKTAIQKRIEELKKYCVEGKCSPAEFATFNHSILELKEILFQSAPLIPEIEKLVDLIKWYDENSDVRPTKKYPTKKGNYYEWAEDYISNLKLNI